MMTRSDMQGHWEVAKIQRTQYMNRNQTIRKFDGLASSDEFWRLPGGQKAVPTWRMCAPNM
jgi:hypothetical protein